MDIINGVIKCCFVFCNVSVCFVFAYFNASFRCHLRGCVPYNICMFYIFFIQSFLSSSCVVVVVVVVV